MLVLTRRTNESIMIGDDVRIVVLDVRGDVVRVGIEAPRSVQVHRAEVYAEVVAQASAAGADTTLDLQELEKAPRARQRSGLRPASAGGQYRVPQPAGPVDSVDVTALESREAMTGPRRG